MNDASRRFDPRTISLSPEQQRLLADIFQFHDHCAASGEDGLYLITGEAGTGTSVVLTHFYDLLRQKYRHEKSIFLVNHPELLKVYRELAGGLPSLLKKDFDRPTSFINRCRKQGETYDTAVIDEAHLLLSQSDPYNRYEGTNQLADILGLAHFVVLVYDPSQVIKTKCWWDEDMIRALAAGRTCRRYCLTRQFRMEAPAPLLQWIDAFTAGRLLPVPQDLCGYDFQVFNDCEAMYEAIVEKDRAYGLSRITATINYPSRLDGGKHYVREGRFALPWDQYNFTAVPWAEIPETIGEVGSLYTVQGFDLNWIGVILGPSLSLDPADPSHILMDAEKVTDPAIYHRRKDWTAPRLARAKEALFRNGLSVLMKRGRKGLYLYAHDPALREALCKAQAR